MLSQCEKVLRVQKGVIEHARQEIEAHVPERQEQFGLLLQDNRAVTKLMDHAYLSHSGSSERESTELLDGMLEAAISVATEEYKLKLHEKDQALARLRKVTRSRESDLKEQHKASLESITSEFDQLLSKTGDLKSDSEALKRRDRAIMGQAVRYANRMVGFFQGVCGVVLFVFALGVITTEFAREPPIYLSIAATIFVLLSTVITILAFMGKGVIGMNVWEARLAKYIFVRRCHSLGIMDHELPEMIEVRGRRISLR